MLVKNLPNGSNSVIPHPAEPETIFPLSYNEPLPVTETFSSLYDHE